jgi:putative oxidoreductase
MKMQLQKIYFTVTGKLEKGPGLPPLLARLTVGTVFLQSGWGKLHDLEKVIGYFTDLGIPYPTVQAPFVATVELVGGLFLLLGFATRLSCIPLIATMVVAIATALAPDLASWTDIFSLSEFLYIVLMTWLFLSGPGPFSVDQIIRKKFSR